MQGQNSGSTRRQNWVPATGQAGCLGGDRKQCSKRAVPLRQVNQTTESKVQEASENCAARAVVRLRGKLGEQARGRQGLQGRAGRGWPSQLFVRGQGPCTTTMCAHKDGLNHQPIRRWSWRACGAGRAQSQAGVGRGPESSVARTSGPLQPAAHQTCWPAAARRGREGVGG